MKFLDFFKKKKDAYENYIGLFLKEDELEVFLYTLQGHNITTLAHKSRPYTSGWDKITEDTDDVLFAIEQETKLKFEKVILFLHSHLVDKQTREINDPYKRQIKNLLKQLELKPLGYIECYEAVVTYLEKRDHTLLNAILVELDNTNLSTYLYLGGRQIYRRDFEKNTSLVHHLNSEFEAMKKDTMLPSRLIVFGEHDFPKEVDEVFAHEFETGYFIQTPKVELFSKDDLTTAFSETFKDQILDKDMPSAGGIEETEPELQPAPDENFEVIHTSSPVKDTKKEIMGFVIGDEVDQDESGGDDDEEETITSPVAKPSKKNTLGALVNVLAANFRKAVPIIKKIVPTKGRKVPYAVAAGVLLLFFGIFSLEYFFHKAVLTVYFPSQKIEKSLEVPAVLGDNQINLRIGTVSAQIADKKATTGKRDVGEKAKGEVTLHNFDDQDHVFSKGSKLTAEGKSFILDQEVKVASASIKTIDGNLVKDPGTKKAPVIAADIGPDSNLAKNTKFQIEDLSASDFFAINEAAFSGGTKKQVQTVAQADITALKKQAISEGAKQAEADFNKAQSGRDEQVLGALTEAAPKKLDFSNEVGEEATELKLNAAIGVTYYMYSAVQLKSYLQKSLASEVKDGFALPSEKIVYKINDAKAEGDQVTLDVDAQGQAVRKFSKDELLKKVAGKNEKQLEKILKNDLHASGFEIKTKSSPVFFLSNRLPLARKNIEIKIDSL